MGRCRRQGQSREGKFEVGDEGQTLHPWEEFRGGEAILGLERLQFQDRSQGGEDVTRYTTP